MDSFDSDWDYEPDLDLLKARLSQTSKKEKGRIQDLIATCLVLSLTKNSVVESESTDMQKEAVSEESANQGQNRVVCNVNPLDIHLILQNVLSHLPVNTLLNCRLVNRFWNSMALPWIYEKSKQRPIMSPMCCSDFERAEILPLSHLRISLTRTNLNFCSGFFTKHGPAIRNLTIVETKFTNTEIEVISHNLNRLWNIFRHVPNLKELTMCLIFIPEIVPNFIFNEEEVLEVSLPLVKRFEISSFKPLSQAFLNGLFTMLPNVKILTLGKINLGQDWELLVAAIQKLNIHTIHRSGGSTETDPLWRALTMETAPRLKLKELSMTLDTEIDLEVLEAQVVFLRLQSECLEVLSLTIKPYDDDIDVNVQKVRFPVMKNLKTLTLRDKSVPYKEDQNYPLEPIQPDQVLNLRTLFIDRVLLKARVFANSEFPGIQEVILAKRNYTDVVPRLTALFPNLKKLINLETSMTLNPMHPNSNCLRNIEELEINVLGTAIYWLVIYESMPSYIDPPGNSLRSLTRLRRLTFSFKSKYGKNPVASIDEIGVSVTFLRLSPQLSLTLRGDFSISDDLAAKLTEHFENIYFVPTGPTLYPLEAAKRDTM